MKTKFYKVALGLAGLALTASTVSAQAPARRTCASVEVLQAQLAADPGLAQRLAAINNQAMQFAASQSAQQAAGNAQRTSAITVTIPVVVHVVYGTASENISDAQIQSQIDVLNEDYHKLNSDYSKTPSVFASQVADVGIQFVLAKRDPSGNATTGIERKSQAAPSGGWGTADKIKSTTYGGMAAWPASQYLNLWVGTIGGGILGYAQFPGGAAATDGVVISPVYFGRTGTVTAPYNLGRTASHEVGHWLNLNHIWGDDNGACTGTDNVADTPNQASENYGTPTFPHVSCSNGPNGDMFMNYMDYVDDKAMFMFSTGQSTRMNALFASGGARVGLLSSLGGVAPTGGTCPTPASLAAGSITNTSATVSWAAASGAVSYNLQYRASGASTWTTVNQTATSKSLTGLTAGTTYQYQVQAVCSGSTGAYSATASFTTTGGTAVTYCASKGTSVAYEYIDYVALGSISRTSGADAGYYNGTASSTTLAAGSAQTISFSAGFVSSAYTEYFKVYIDYNQNGVFTDAGETVVSAAGSSVATTRTGSFTVPSTAKNGATRMRVVMSDNSATTSCGSYSYGETEDYTVTITGGTARTDGSTARNGNPNAAADQYTLYPNPATDVLSIARPLNMDPEQPFTVRVFDLRGSEIKGLPLSEEGQLNVSNLRPGIYMLTLKDGASTTHQRFVKQ